MWICRSISGPAASICPRSTYGSTVPRTAGNTWMSHAHSDHAHGLHGRIFGTPETLGSDRERVTIPPDYCPECTEMPFGQPIEYHGVRLTAFPASHILGAAQLLIEYKGQRLCIGRGRYQAARSAVRGFDRSDRVRPSDRRIHLRSADLPFFKPRAGARPHHRIRRRVSRPGCHARFRRLPSRSGSGDRSRPVRGRDPYCGSRIHCPVHSLVPAGGL